MRLLLGLLLALAWAVPAQAAPRCLGAASRDPERPCHNPRLRTMVTPTPDQALLTPNLQCTQQTGGGCEYGVAPEQAQATVALLGDSHAAHWRGAVEWVARRLRWHVDELSMSHCPFSTARPVASTGAQDTCPQHNADVVAWLGDHPEVQTVIVSANRGDPIDFPDGVPHFTYRVQTVLEQWDRLPASVRRIVVLLDDPTDRLSTFDCVRRAMRRHRDAGYACRVPRHEALYPDPNAAAARKTARAASLISFTPQFCARRFCFPVVGGVLVHKDTNHIGQLFGRTLAPILLRRIRGLMGL